MDPEMLKCLILVATDIDASSAAPQEQHYPLQLVIYAVLGIC